MEWAMESIVRSCMERVGQWNPISRIGFSPFNPYFHPMTGLLDLVASWLHGEGLGNGMGNGIP